MGADVADRLAVRQMFQACEAQLGPLVTLVNNTGIIGGNNFLVDLTEDALARTFATNLFGAVYCMQDAIVRMATDRGGHGGSIINMSSLAATIGSPGEYVHYAASKGAIETLTVGAGKELGPVGIRVGTTATDLHAREGNPDRPGKVAAATPLGRIAAPQDIADAAVWLASPETRFVSGTVLTVAVGIAP